MRRRVVYIGRAIGLLKLALLALVVIDLAHLTYEHRLKAYVFSFLASKFTVPSVAGSPHVCESNSWWFASNGTGPERWQHISKEEEEFPLAYTIMAFERPDQVWRLLRSIYRPQNYYCIHFDKKSPELYKKWLHRKISSCIPPEVSKNVFFISSISVYHSYMSVLEADLACMRALWQLPKKGPESKTSPWKYLINLTGQEFPLKNNLELVRILSVLNNANLVQQEKFFYVRRAWRDPPHGLQLHKGAVHVVVTWDFINFLFTDKRVKDLLDYLPEVGIPDEALFSTVNHNAILNAPGNFPYGDEVYRNGGFYVNRWKHFFPEECSGVWRHAVCIFDLYGMRPLFTPDSPYLFVNKFVMHINAPVLDVTERWFYNWQEWYYRHIDQNVTNLDFFRNLPQLRHATSAWGRIFYRDGHTTILGGPAGESVDEYIGRDREVVQKIEEEMQKYDDIVLADYEDTCFNLTWKTVTNLRWLSALCDKKRNDVFVIRDDDNGMNVSKVVQFLASIPNEKKRTTLYGYIARHDTASRTLLSKFFLSYREVPWDLMCPYRRGFFCQIIGPDIIDDMAIGLAYTRHNYLQEDVCLGLLAYKLGISLQHVDAMFSESMNAKPEAMGAGMNYWNSI